MPWRNLSRFTLPAVRSLVHGSKKGLPQSRQVGAQASREPTHLRSVANDRRFNHRLKCHGLRRCMSPRNSHSHANLAHHGFDFAQHLHEAFAVRTLVLLHGELPSSDKPSDAPGRRARHRGHGCLEKRYLPCGRRRRTTQHCAAARLHTASLLEFSPDQSCTATAPKTIRSSIEGSQDVGPRALGTRTGKFSRR